MRSVQHLDTIVLSAQLTVNFSFFFCHVMVILVSFPLGIARRDRVVMLRCRPLQASPGAGCLGVVQGGASHPGRGIPQGVRQANLI